MSGDHNKCRDHAEHCRQLAAATDNPLLKQSFIELAQKWAALARNNEGAVSILKQRNVEPRDRRTG
jgi:hypothetical protein